jgi:phage virion morphogenesis protein
MAEYSDGGLGVDLSVVGVEYFNRKLDLIVRTGKATKSDLLESVGALVESQTRRRIEQEKEGPSGQQWPDWNPLYAMDRHGNQSLLEGSGALVDSIQSLVTGDQVEVGTNLIYAGVHQHGAVITPVKADKLRFNMGGKHFAVDSVTVPARPFVGVSDDNLGELSDLLNDWIMDVIK